MSSNCLLDDYHYWILHVIRCDVDALEDALCKRVMVTPEEIIKRSLDPQSAAVSRDGFAKTIYSRLFDW
jgi:myosin-5